MYVYNNHIHDKVSGYNNHLINVTFLIFTHILYSFQV